MAIVSLNKKIFEKEIGKLDGKMEEKIAIFGTPIDGQNDEEIQIEVFPNRPDMLSYHGFKRAFLAYLGKDKGIKIYKINKPEKDYIVKIDSSVKPIRPYTACAIVKGLNLDDTKIKEIIELQEKLHMTIGRKRKKMAIGIYPLETIKLPIEFKAVEPDKIKFIPLESDRVMSGFEILQKHPTGKEYAHLLAGKSKFPIFVDAKGEVLSMPPIINSQLTGRVTNETKNVFVECSGFDFEIQKKCLNIIVTSLAEMGGSIYQMEIKYSKKEITPDLSSEKMKISIDNTNKILGTSMKEKDIQKYLESMGYNYSNAKVEIPPWSTDILHEVDLIEDIAIAYGYNNFEPVIPDISTIGHEDQRWILKKRVSEILTGLGLIEVSNYYLTSKQDQIQKMGLNEKEGKNQIELKESKTDYNVLRQNLTHYLLKNLSENVDVEYPHKIFEIGRVFDKDLKETEKLSIALSPSNFTQVKEIIDYISKMIGTKIKVVEAKNFPAHFIEGRAGKITIGNESIGYVGEVHPKILKEWKIKMPVSLLEISLEEIFKNLM